MERSPKVATPPMAETVRVPLRVPPGEPGPRARLTALMSEVTRLQNWSSTCTVTAGLMVAPGNVSEGWTPKTSCVAGLGPVGTGLGFAPVQLGGVVGLGAAVGGGGYRGEAVGMGLGVGTTRTMLKNWLVVETSPPSVATSV